MKKLLATLLVAAMAVGSLTACSSTSKEPAPAETTANDAADTTDAAADTAETTEAGDTAAATADPIKVGMVTDVGGVNDHSFNQTSWEGLQRASAELGIEVNYLESKADSDYTANIETFIDEEYDLIICVGYMLADATRTAAEAYPDQKFAIIDDASNADLPNVACLMFEQAQASYLVGLVAGMQTESNQVGFVLGMASEAMHQFGYGYVAGVLDANPDAKVLQYNANTFADAAVGKTAAVDMITRGADVVFQAAGATGVGAIEACVENNVWAIGVDTDQSSLAPENMITSAMKRVDSASFDISKSVMDGTFEAGVHTYGLESGGVDIAPTQDLLSEEIIAAVEKAKTDIASGTIKVPSNQADFEAAYGDVYELD